MISWVVIHCTLHSLPGVWAQSSEPASNTRPSDLNVRQQPLQRPPQQPLPDFSGDGRPGRRIGGGSRSPCSVVELPLIALVPVTNFGKTVAERPTFWFYVPYSVEQAPVGEFVLQSEEGNDFYRLPVVLPTKTPGFVSFSPPPSVAPLESNKWYRWYFKLYCEPARTSVPVFVDGWVQRVELPAESERELRSVTARDYAVYAANRIWFDAIAQLAQLRLSDSANDQLQQEWVSLLGAKGVELQHLSRMPLIGSTQLEQQVSLDQGVGQ